MSRLTRDETAEFVSRDQILRRERGQGNINFPCSADREQDWQYFPVDPYSCYDICVTIHTYIQAHAVWRRLRGKLHELPVALKVQLITSKPFDVGT